MEGQNRTPASPVDRLLPEFQAALKELGKVEAARNELLRRWATAKAKLTNTPHGPGLRVEFERLTAQLHEIEARFNQSHKRVRELDIQLGTALTSWRLPRHQAAERPSATANRHVAQPR